MADGESKESSSKTSLFEDLSFLVWGPNIKEEVFKRWTQGFVFSPDEPSALVQEQGGPCAVIASVQAYILKNMLFSDGVSSTSNWRQITSDQVQSILVCSLCEMLEKAKTEDSAIKVVTLKDHIKLPSKNAECARLKEEGEGETTSTSSKSPSESTEFHKTVCNQELHLQSSRDVHSLLSSVECESVKEARSLIERNFHIFEGLYGILLFLYSMILTRGLEIIKSEMSDPGEPLVDENFGYGSQTLINLLMTGQAVSNVWNFSKAVGGLELKGIPKQSEIGFLTILEAHRYCEVGSFLKCPIYPIWLLGSETHITVLFCIDRSLSGVESPKEEAQRVFNSFDEQENGFIESDKLSDILDKLGLETDPEYVKFMQSRLDPDSIGVILLPNFMDEFFPGENMQPQWTDPFVVYHYNGLGIKSDKSHTNKIVFIEGMACIEPTDNSNIAEEEIVTCLKTKWTGISVTWESRNPPSLN